MDSLGNSSNDLRSDRAGNGADHGAVKQPKRKPRRKPRIDLRSREGRRVIELVRAYRARLGAELSSDPVVAARIRQAAELQALSESLRGRALRADPNVSADDVIRCARASDLAIRRLRLDERAAPAGPSLSEYLQSKAAGEKPSASDAFPDAEPGNSANGGGVP